MRPVWTGAISFGLISIPVALCTAAARDEIRFRLLRASDLSPVNYKINGWPRLTEARAFFFHWRGNALGFVRALSNFEISSRLPEIVS